MRRLVASGGSPETFLRIRIVGHASPRWRSASDPATADVRNERLALDRAEAVKAELLWRLAEWNLAVPVEIDVSVADDERHAIAVGAHGEGSREALERTGGERTGDEPRDRRVDIEFELVKTRTGVRTVQLPPERRSARTRDWRFTVTGFREIAAGAALVDIDLEIKNPLSGRVANGSARLYGGGINVGNPSKSTREKPGSTAVGPPDLELRTDRQVGFGAFDGCLLRVERAQASIGIGRKALWIVFIDLTDTPIKVEGGWDLGKPAVGGYVVSGKLELDDVPPDWYTVARTATVPYKRKSGLGHADAVYFDTGSDAVGQAGRERIEQLVDDWVRRFTR